MTESAERFCQQERIRSRSTFQKLYQLADKQHTHTLVLYVGPNHSEWRRLGITVSRKIGEAVTRNRIKRQIREIFRRNKASIPVGLDLVVNVKRAASKASFQEIEGDLLRALDRWKRYSAAT